MSDKGGWSHANRAETKSVEHWLSENGSVQKDGLLPWQ
jgi:hypothetical protein